MSNQSSSGVRGQKRRALSPISPLTQKILSQPRAAVIASSSETNPKEPTRCSETPTTQAGNTSLPGSIPSVPTSFIDTSQRHDVFYIRIDHQQDSIPQNMTLAQYINKLQENDSMKFVRLCQCGTAIVASNHHGMTVCPSCASFSAEPNSTHRSDIGNTPTRTSFVTINQEQVDLPARKMTLEQYVEYLKEGPYALVQRCESGVCDNLLVSSGTSMTICPSCIPGFVSALNSLDQMEL